MAKRRKKTSRRRGRRMGSPAKRAGAMIGQAAGIVAGAIIGKKVAGVIPVTDERIKNAAVLAIGVIFPSLLKNEWGKAIGNGMIAVGGAQLAANFLPALGATDETMEFPVTVGEVPDNISVIAGDDSVMAGDDISVLAGMEEDEYGY